MKLSGWGRFPSVETRLAAPRDDAELIAIVRAGSSIARGNGRAYGDSAVNPATTIHTRHFNRMLAFDRDAGRITVEAGVMLADVIKACLPHGWFPPVTPGTKFVTIGGMVAADVHGKNHHRHGSFRNFVDWIDLVCEDGTVRRCAPDENSELFDWTIGGMGLTGIILRVAFRLRAVETGWIRQRTVVASGIDAAIDHFEASRDSTYAVAWIDCLTRGSGLGRSLITLGEHAGRDELGAGMPAIPDLSDIHRQKTLGFDFPNWALNSLSVRAFNGLYFRMGKGKPDHRLVGWNSYFYPLDSILGWNRIYGRRGFAQYQCAIPLDQARDGLRALLDCISASGTASFLAVLKRLGPQTGNFSFPLEGYTLALDFPVSQRSLDLMDRLDDITARHDGRINLAKDSRMSAEMLARTDDRAGLFGAYRKARGSDTSFASSQSTRLRI